jgi:hypothetical protein
MMGGFLNYIELKAKAKTGLNAAVIIWAVVAALGAAATIVFIIFSAFIWLANRYDPLTAALLLTAFFLVVAAIAAVCSLAAHRRVISEAQLALQSRANAAAWLDPKYLATGLQIGRAIGWRRIVPLVAVGVLTAGLAREWFANGNPPEQTGDPDD